MTLRLFFPLLPSFLFVPSNFNFTKQYHLFKAKYIDTGNHHSFKLTGSRFTLISSSVLILLGHRPRPKKLEEPFLEMKYFNLLDTSELKIEVTDCFTPTSRKFLIVSNVDVSRHEATVTWFRISLEKNSLQ